MLLRREISHHKDSQKTGVYKSQEVEDGFPGREGINGVQGGEVGDKARKKGGGRQPMG